MDSFGIVHLEGRHAAAQHGRPDLLVPCPAARRPQRVGSATFAGTYADLEVAATASQPHPAAPAPVTDFRFVSLEARRPSGAGTRSGSTVELLGRPGRVHRPGLVKDGSGIVHLQGAVRQTHAVGADQNVIGNVPAAARPARDVFEIVHTFNGTYADLEVATTGEISLIDPSVRGQGLSFVSLEDVSYSPGAIFNSMRRRSPG